ncbi:MAG TPA: class I SAM-dependent methyltransferase [Desulfobulbus sp.]|nr:class I SAM-dependent methyltransferase [Desulfobulbus sp.]
MIESNNPRIDVAELLALVQKEVDRQRQKVETGGSEAAAAQEGETNNPYQWAQLSATLDVAQQNVDAGARLSTFLNYRRSVRWLVRGVGRVILYFGRVITVPQRDFNSAILHALRITLNGIRDMNRFTDQTVRRLDARLEEQAGQLAELARRDREKDHLIGHLKASLVMQERRISLFLDEARRCLPETFSQEQLGEFVREKGHLLDSLYVTFEDKFRGTRGEIRERLRVYLDILRAAGAGSEEQPVLDIGCGRGEWLELLRDEGLAGRGVDLNDTLAHQCRERGLAVETGDAIAHLRSLPEASLGAVTGFHIIEHLPMETQLELYGEAVRVLRPGGVAIFETPNPQNLLVGACNFYADPTHKRPLYPETQKFFLEYRGFSRVELKFLHPHEPGARLPEDEAPELAARLNDLLSCARDYAVIGYRP